MLVQNSEPFLQKQNPDRSGSGTGLPLLLMNYQLGNTLKMARIYLLITHRQIEAYLPITLIETSHFMNLETYT